jgi:hypothetical protein
MFCGARPIMSGRFGRLIMTFYSYSLDEEELSDRKFITTEDYELELYSSHAIRVVTGADIRGIRTAVECGY